MSAQRGRSTAGGPPRAGRPIHGGVPGAGPAPRDTSGRGSTRPGQEALPVRHLAERFPGLMSHLLAMGVPVEGNEDSSLAFLCEEAGLDPAEVMASLGRPREVEGRIAAVRRIEVVGGQDKDGRPEAVRSLVLEPGQAVALVGATGSGKSQLLADVESMAQGDSPSRRVILLDGAPPSEELRWSPSARPVAQVSQGMRFLLDVAVGAFLEMHAASRGAADPRALAEEAVQAACGLCGEPFSAQTQLATLSGGQSRALMIADAALISASPIILIDEIENAGIDREKALGFLVGQGKIALLATHDPLLALRADRRVVLVNGSMKEVVTSSASERGAIEWLEEQDREIVRIRDCLRRGERIDVPGVGAGRRRPEPGDAPEVARERKERMLPQSAERPTAHSTPDPRRDAPRRGGVRPAGAGGQERPGRTLPLPADETWAPRPPGPTRDAARSASARPARTGTQERPRRVVPQPGAVPPPPAPDGPRAGATPDARRRPGAIQAWAAPAKRQESPLMEALRGGARFAARGLLRRLMMFPEDLEDWRK